MSDAPERIWARSGAYPYYSLDWMDGEWSVEAGSSDPEYIRADIAEAEAATLRAKLAEARAAMTQVRDDCMDRAKASRDGATVPIGASAWLRLCALLEWIAEDAK